MQDLLKAATEYYKAKQELTEESTSLVKQVREHVLPTHFSLGNAIIIVSVSSVVVSFVAVYAKYMDLKYKKYN